MRRIMLAALGAAMMLTIMPAAAASPPSTAKQTEHTEWVNVKRSDPSPAIAASAQTFQARVKDAIAELCPDDTLNSAQRSCELRVRSAVQAQLAEEPIQK